MARENRSGEAPNFYPLGHPRNPHSAVEVVQQIPQPHVVKSSSSAPKTATPAPVPVAPAAVVTTAAASSDESVDPKTADTKTPEA